MSGEFDSSKHLHSIGTKALNILKLSFREFCGSKLSGLHPFDNMAIIHRIKNRLKTER